MRKRGRFLVWFVLLPLAGFPHPAIAGSELRLGGRLLHFEDGAPAANVSVQLVQGRFEEKKRTLTDTGRDVALGER
jgi:hypothetical protein